jgi:hypothetical protein
LSSSVTPSVDNGETSLQSAERASDRLCTTTLTFGCLNIRSLLNRFDDVMELLRHQRIGVLSLVESWHDPESAVIGRLRCAGFNVIDRPRPRVMADDLSVNHGGIVVVAANDVVVSPITSLTGGPTTFELVAVRVAVGHFAGIVVTLYRPGSVAVQQTFFEELASVLDRVATYNVPVYVVGDFNIRLDRLDDPHAAQLRLLVESYGLLLHDTGLTHKCGGTLDAVISRADTGCPDSVNVMDVGFSDHHMLLWSINVTRVTPSVTTVCSRPWRQLDYDHFQTLLSASKLCQPDSWPADINEMAALYDSELNRLLDQLIPCRQFVRRPRPSDPWFDGDCRASKRLTRRLERAYAATCRRASAAAELSSVSVDRDSSTDITAAKSAWYAQRRNYRRLRQQKCNAFWSERIESDRADPRKLWQSVDTLLGRGRTPASSSISVETFNQFFRRQSCQSAS